MMIFIWWIFNLPAVKLENLNSDKFTLIINTQYTKKKKKNPTLSTNYYCFLKSLKDLREKWKETQITINSSAVPLISSIMSVLLLKYSHEVFSTEKRSCKSDSCILGKKCSSKLKLIRSYKKYKQQPELLLIGCLLNKQSQNPGVRFKNIFYGLFLCRGKRTMSPKSSG